MKRMTISVPDQLGERLEAERRRRGMPATALVREALASFLTAEAEPGRLPFIGIGHSGFHDTARNVDAILNNE